MATKRMIKTSLPKSKKMRRLKDDTTRLLFYMLCVSCDDDAKMDADPEDIRADLFGGRDKIKIQDVNKMLTNLAEQGLIIFYQDKNTKETYLSIPCWLDTNVIPEKRHKPSVLPCFSEESHTLLAECIHNVNKCMPSIEENRVVKNREEENSIDTLSGKPDIPYEEIINDLNLKANTQYRHTSQKTKDAIKARFNEGFKKEDFFIVHDKKVKDWILTEHAKYLRPETLYSNKFEGYLNQLEKDTRFSDVTRQNVINAKSVLQKRAERKNAE